ncbi:coiled-coil domain-containing protein 113 [Frankliniella occidentalis]|uniref:Cilia- and flagella-associated protein 263 n=1 Tax=Frankliniella occidentalis TaxID=133901 RepID=A0A6J1SJJ7_FRAOC|nr:coiled-coil domain-containing protein 113 [Frankliniella occidentalis]
MAAVAARRSASAQRSASARTLDVRTGSYSEPTPSTLSRELSFSKTVSSADAFIDVVPEALSYEELEEAVTLLVKANLMLRLENEIFHDKLYMDTPDLLAGLSEIIELEKKEEAIAQQASPKAEQETGGVEPESEHKLESLHKQESVKLESVHKMESLHEEDGESGSPTPSPPPSRSLSRSDEPPRARSRITLSAVSDTLSSTARLSAIRAKAAAKASARASAAKAKSSKTGSLDRVPRMSFSQRMDLAEEATHLTTQRTQQLVSRAEAQAADLRARAEEAQVRLGETLAAYHSLDTGVTDKAQGDAHVSGRTSGEKLNRYMTDWVKQADATIDRIRLKVSSLRAHHRRVRENIAVKRELGDALRPVDFDKIRIEIEELNRKIESNSQHLNDLKGISGSATSRLLAGKKRLSDLSKHLEAIRKETAAKRNQKAALELEEQKVLEDVGRADTALNAVRMRMERHTAPDVLVYVRLKQDLDLLRRDVVVWERRCKIQQQTARDLRRAMGRASTSTRAVRGAGGEGPAVPGGGHGRRGGHAAEETTNDATDSSSGRAGPPTSAPRRRRPRRRQSQSRGRAHAPSSSSSSACGSGPSGRSSSCSSRHSSQSTG